MSDDDYLDSTVEVTVSRDRDGLVRVLSGQKAMLLVLSGPRMGHRTLLGEGEVIIGRGSTCGLVLEGDAVSRQHARVDWTGGAHRVADMRSTNGLFVNYERVADRVLRDGDRVQIGKVLLKYIAGDNIEAAYHEEFDRLVRHDALTGALNKAAFDEELRVALSNRDGSERRVSLILFDLDHFKQINDTHGHTAGDMVLQAVGEMVAGLVPDPHRFARVGGEEFAVILLGAGAAEATGLAERIRMAIEDHSFEFDEKKIPVTLSLGVTETRLPMEAPEALYERADQQLYAAKRGGRNQVRTA